MILGVSLNASLPGGTVWNGPTTNFVQTFGTTVGSGTNDHLTARVIINRGVHFPIYNQVLETSANKTDSPKDTEWAFGSLPNTNLTYQPFYTFATASSPFDVAGGIVGKDAICHLKTDDIFLQVHFTAWGQSFSGSFAYMRTTPSAVAPTPSVTITNPPSGTVYASPANIKIGAMASVSSGSVTNVKFFRGATLIGSSTTSPYSVTATNLTNATYNLTAVATAAGISATSSVVTVTVVNPVPVVLSTPVISNGIVSFNFSADPGLLYSVQSTSNFVNWNFGPTNSAAVNPMPFSEAAPPTFRFYRVSRQPNP